MKGGAAAVDARLVKEFAERLRKLIKKNQIADGRQEVDEILGHLEKSMRKPSIALLTETKIGVPVQRLSNKAKVPELDDDLRQRAAALVAGWKRRVAKLENQPTKPGKKTAPAAASGGEKKRSKKAASSKPAPLSRASSTASTGSASAALSPRSAAPGALPPPGSTDDERLAFFAKKFEFWNRDLDTETMRVKRRVVIFKKLALLRERLRPLLGGADVSDHDFFLKFVHAAENIEGALFRIYSKKPKTLLETMRNLVFGLGKNPTLVENVMLGVGVTIVQLNAYRYEMLRTLCSVFTYRLCACAASGNCVLDQNILAAKLVKMSPDQLQTEQQREKLKAAVEKVFDTLDKDQQKAKAMAISKAYRVSKVSFVLVPDRMSESCHRITGFLLNPWGQSVSHVSSCTGLYRPMESTIADTARRKNSRPSSTSVRRGQPTNR